MTSKIENDEIVPQPRRDLTARLLALCFFLSFVAGLVLILGGGEAGVYGELASSGIDRPGIAVIDISGAIGFDDDPNPFGTGMRGASSIAESIRLFSENRLVRGLVLRINSPGGTIAATQEVYNAVKRFREGGKPVVVSMGDVAASGGYYIACAASRIFANPGSITGSIGVIMRSPNLKGLYDLIKIDWNVIKSGRFKDIMSEHRAMTDEERALLGDMVQDSYEQFFGAVHTSREITREKLEELAQGQVFSGRQAQKEGLVDELGDFEDALLSAADLAGIRGRPSVIRERLGNTLLDFLGIGAALSKAMPSLPIPSRQAALPAYLMPGISQ